MDREVWRAAVHRVSKSQTQLSNWTELNQYTYIIFTKITKVVQWLRLHTPNAGGWDSIAGQGTRHPMPQLRPNTVK